MSVTVIYGSDGGTTRKIASRIASKISAQTLDIKKAQVSDLENSSLLILGCPTYGDGTLQSDWEENIEVLENADLDQKTVALFGTGDQFGYPESFVDAIGILYDIVTEKGAKVIGFTDTKGYDFSSSAAVRDGRFVGLVLDEDNQSAKSDARITAWINQIK